jgi:hypothetical protein
VAGKTSRQALNSFLAPLQRALSCVTDAVLYCRLAPGARLDGTATLLPQTRLKAVTETFYLSVTLYFRFIEGTGAPGPYRVTTTAYYYSLFDSDEREIIAYHWHPHGDIAFPHLHICAGARIGRADLRDAHIPTGRIALEDLLRMAITEFGVVPRRDDWREALAQTQAASEQ